MTITDAPAVDTKIDTASGIVVRKRVYVDDLDAYGMLHHARYALLFDNAVIDFWHEAGWRLDRSQAVFVIRELALTYHRAIVGIGDVDVHLWIERAGTSSVTYRFEVLSTDHVIRHADGSRVVVFLDPHTLRPTPIPDEIWQLAAPLLRPGVERASYAPESS
jgi:acyl-CoA thioester hydrolase